MKEWFILVNGKQEGPYNIRDLKRHPGVTPDTLIWKEGFADWVAARFVPEVEELFRDEPESQPIQDRLKPKPTSVDLQQDQETLTLGRDPSSFYLWLIIFVLILCYLIFRFYS